MQTISNLIVLILAIWMLARLMGIHIILDNIMANRRARQQAVKLTQILLIEGSKKEIVAFVYDYRNSLKLNELGLLLDRVKELNNAERESKGAPITKREGKGAIN